MYQHKLDDNYYYCPPWICPRSAGSAGVVSFKLEGNGKARITSGRVPGGELLVDVTPDAMNAMKAFNHGMVIVEGIEEKDLKIIAFAPARDPEEMRTDNLSSLQAALRCM